MISNCAHCIVSTCDRSFLCENARVSLGKFLASSDQEKTLLWDYVFSFLVASNKFLSTLTLAVLSGFALAKGQPHCSWLHNLEVKDYSIERTVNK
jgi:hypothetical protein